MEIKDATSDSSSQKCFKLEVGTLEDSCRVCMAPGSGSVQLFDGGSSIIDRVLFCTGIRLVKEDGLPTKVCISCVSSLCVAHKFKTTCLIANETFQKMLMKIKFEDIIEETHFDDDNGVFEDMRDVKRETAEVKSQSSLSTSKTSTRKKRGPYNKTGKAKNRLKLKFSRLKCVPCGLTFESKEKSDDHKKLVHKESESFVCEICGKVFYHRSSHYTHIRSHQPPKYGCEQCSYKTWHKFDLVKHVRIHTGVKMYQCEFCSASYRTSSNLTCHIRQFHEGVKRFQCHLCDRSFYDRTKYNRHQDSHNDIKRYECEICHSCFTRRCYWKKHLQRQHGVVVPAARPGRQKVNLLVGQISSGSFGEAVVEPAMA